jgi:hypothetical protein
MATARTKRAPAPRARRETQVAPGSTRVPSLVATLRERGSLSAKELGALGVPPTQRPETVALLVAEGFEASAGGARVPLAEQLAKLVADRELVPLDPRKLLPLVRGAKASELAGATKKLVAAGGALVVVRGKKQAYLARSTAPTLAPDRLGEVAAEAQALVALCKLALAHKPARASLWGADVAEAVGSLRALASKAAASPARAAPLPAPPATPPALALTEAFAALRGALRASVGLAFVPEAVSALERHASRAEVHEALLALHASGAVELRGEAGVGRFTADELDRCPPGPQGLRLVWARLVRGWEVAS